MICVRTFDERFIRTVLRQPEFRHVFEDGSNADNVMIETQREIWASVSIDGEIVGLMHAKPVNNTTLDLHPKILKSHRGKAHRAVRQFLQWTDENLPPCYNKLTASIPDCYRHIKLFCLQMGFKKEGVNREAARLNGDFVDLIMYGITRNEIKERVIQWKQ